MTSVHHQFIAIIIIIIIPSLSCISTKLNPFHHSLCSPPSLYILRLDFYSIFLGHILSLCCQILSQFFVKYHCFFTRFVKLKRISFYQFGEIFFSASCFSSCFHWSGYPFDILLFFPRFNINWLLLTVVFKRVGGGILLWFSFLC